MKFIYQMKNFNQEGVFESAQHNAYWIKLIWKGKTHVGFGANMAAFVNIFEKHFIVSFNSSLHPSLVNPSIVV